MELFSIRIQRTFQLVSTSQDVLLAVLPVKCVIRESTVKMTIILFCFKEFVQFS